ncbi:MAG TPA: hypothetical protein VIU11_14585 [Nakamurella sp.]
MLTAEAHHWDHAIVEQVIADLKLSPQALPVRIVIANPAGLDCAVIACDLFVDRRSRDDRRGASGIGGADEHARAS